MSCRNPLSCNRQHKDGRYSYQVRLIEGCQQVCRVESKDIVNISDHNRYGTLCCGSVRESSGKVVFLYRNEAAL